MEIMICVFYIMSIYMRFDLSWFLIIFIMLSTLNEFSKISVSEPCELHTSMLRLNAILCHTKTDLFTQTLIPIHTY